MWGGTGIPLIHSLQGISPSPAPPTPTPEAQAVFEKMPDEMPSDLRSAVADFVNSQVAAGNWDKIVDFVYLGMNTESNSLTGWKGVITSTLSNAYWSIYSDCYTDGTSGSYINTGFTPNDVAAWGLNDCGIGTYVKLNNNKGTGSKTLFGVIEADTTKQVLLSQTGSGGSTLIMRLNTSTNNTSTSDNVFDDFTFYALDKTDETTIHLIKGADTVETKTVVNGAKATIPVYLGARNNQGSDDFNMDASFKFFFVYQSVGFDYAAFKSGFETLISSVDALVDFIPLIFAIGQSNSQGRGEKNRADALTSYDTGLPSIKIYYKSAYDTTDNGNWRKMLIGTNNVEPINEATLDTFGAELSLATKIFQNHDVPVYYIKAGLGGTSLGNSLATDWDPNNTGEAYDISVDAYLLPSITKIQTEFPGKTILPIILWHQGETDAKDSRADDYLVNFTALVSALRAEHSLLLTAPLMITKLYFDLIAGETTINNAFDTYVASASNVYVFDVASQVTYPRKTDLPASIKSTYPPTGSDDSHNSYEFQIKKGELIYDKLVEIGFFG